jgi:hypothetical protein
MLGLQILGLQILGLHLSRSIPKQMLQKLKVSNPDFLMVLVSCYFRTTE